MSPKAKVKVRLKTAFVCAGIDQEILHLEADSLTPETSLVQLLDVCLKWAQKSSGPESFKHKRRLPPASSPPPIDALTFLQGIVEHSYTSAASTAPALSDLDLLKGLNKEERDYYNLQDGVAKRAILDALLGLKSAHAYSVPLRFRVLESALPLEIKRKIIQKLERQQDAASGDAVKYYTWVEGLLGLPLTHYIVPQALPQDVVKATLSGAAAYLDQVVFGHKAAKQAIIERLYMWLKHGFVAQRPLALKGCPGNGKTSLIREGLAVIMNRPFNFVALGGSFDSSFLLGHSYTYEGSTSGRLAEGLAASQCMNPIFFFDEVDKCSSTAKGEEVVNALVHLTDVSQNVHFRDRYFSGLDLDMSRSLMIFAFNDAQKVSPVLLDRFQVVQTDNFDAAAQAKILKNYLLPRILAEHGLPADFIRLSEGALREAAQGCVEGGVRCIRSIIEQVVCKASIFQETRDASLMHPLTPRDLYEREGKFELRGGVALMLAEGRKGLDGAPPPGMYS